MPTIEDMLADLSEIKQNFEELSSEKQRALEIVQLLYMRIADDEREIQQLRKMLKIASRAMKSMNIAEIRLALQTLNDLAKPDMANN